MRCAASTLPPSSNTAFTRHNWHTSYTPSFGAPVWSSASGTYCFNKWVIGTAFTLQLDTCTLQQDTSQHIKHPSTCVPPNLHELHRKSKTTLVPAACGAPRRAVSIRQLLVLGRREILAAVGRREPPDQRQLLCRALRNGQLWLRLLRRTQPLSVASLPSRTSKHPSGLRQKEVGQL